MTGFEDILKLVRFSQNMPHSFRLSSQISEMLKFQEGIAKSLSGANMITEIAKKTQHHKKAIGPMLSAIEAMTSSMRFESKFVIPQTAIDSIIGINRQHEQLFSGIRAMTEAVKIQSPALAKINNLSFALSGISGQVAAMAANQRKWDLIDDFEEITEEAVSLNDRIFDDNGVTKEGLNELKTFFQRIEIKVDKIDADANGLFWKFLTILGFILTVMGEARNWSPKPEYVTKQEVETVIKGQFSIYEKKLKEDKEFRITRRVCKVMSKPRLKSLVIEKLPIDFEVTVLQVNHKWVYVAYFSPVDNLPQTGWIMKKYLDKPE